ncbi:MAG: metallophosphoesterase [Magnetococcales bacterium]|nr:metallophosphoesterase [Magnetococcales bacterium]
MKIAWITDPHFEFLSKDQLVGFVSTINCSGANMVVITGDIITYRGFRSLRLSQYNFMKWLGEQLTMPLYFVFGNHDYYKGSIKNIRQKMDGLPWLPKHGIIPLTEKTCLIGHDGWADGRSGDFLASPVQLNDYRYIEELTCYSMEELLSRLNALGNEAADYISTVLPQALDKFLHIILATHVPPYRGACWHEGAISDDDWAPHFVCQAVGDVLTEIMKAHPKNTLTVLCGHTHGKGFFSPEENIRVYTGGSEYERPKIQGVFDADVCFSNGPSTHA